MVFANYLVIKWKQKYEEKRSAADSKLSGTLSDSMTNSSTIKLFASSKHEMSLFEAVAEDVRSIRLWTWNIDSLIRTVQGFLTIIVEIAVMFSAFKLYQKGQLTLGDFVLFQTYILTLTEQMWQFGWVLKHLFEAFADAKEMVEIIDNPYDVQDVPNAGVLKVTEGKIDFTDVVFNFNETRKVLDGFSLSIAPGEKVALIGPSGAGKTTVTRLLFRFHDVTSGTILIDGQDISKVTQDSLRNEIALVPQEPILFHRSLMDNIRYGRRDATDEEVLEAAKKARCHEFISSLPDGYETMVGERGVKLSGGERQRVAIARAILKDAPILVLDEATSSLDSESEHLIQEALNILMEGKTVIVIAHRLSTIITMDRIIVIEGGNIRAMGTHDELLKKDDLYKKLWSIQAGGFLKEE
jgi:ATP-binding cassette subfamily B protein